MEILKLHIISIVFLFGATSMCFLAVRISFSTARMPWTSCLAIVMVILSVYMTEEVFATEQWLSVFPHILGVAYPLMLATGPLLWLFVAKNVNGRRFSAWHLFHFIPTAIAILYYAPWYIVPTPQKLQVVERMSHAAPEMTVFGLLLLNIKVLLNLIYVAGIFRMILASTSPHCRPGRLFQITAGLVAFWLVYGISGWICFAAQLNPEWLDKAGLLTLTCLIAVFVWTSLDMTSISGHSRAKYSRATATAEELSEIVGQANHLLVTERMFLNPDLRLVDLSSRIGIPSGKLSYALHAAESNFNDMVNRHRVEEVIRRLRKHAVREFSLIAIAFDAGFNSKTAFNRAFKKSTSMTPTEYLNQISLIPGGS